MNVHRHEASFGRHAKAQEWLVTYDMLNSAMRNDRDYGLMPYLPYSLVPFFPLFQERGATRIERPKQDWEVCSSSSSIH
jgi:chromosome transmission fidelity protein 18